MKRKRSKKRWSTIGVILLALAGGAYYVNELLVIGAAYHAKTLCSGVFVSGREPEAVEREDIGIARHPVLTLVRASVNRDAQSVTAGLFGLPQREAIYREGLGCTLAIGISPQQLRAEIARLPPTPRETANRRRSDGDIVESGLLARAIDAGAIRATVDAAFSEPDPNRQRRTRAIIVLYDGHIIAERYAPGFSAHTRLPGWSMSKTMTSALVGILKDQGKLALDQPAPVPEWHHAGDPRGKITLSQLLHMNSGLEFNEDYTKATSDVVLMLFAHRDMAAYASSKPLAGPPGSIWNYSTGTTNILSRVVSDAAGKTIVERLTFPRRALFDPLGMTSAVIEADATNTMVGSSLMFASARDWARFGLLYLRDGVWNGKRILPAGWVEYSRTPTPPPPENATSYGAHLWLKVPKPYYRQIGMRPTLPRDAFHMIGHNAQFVSVVPSRKLVVVRLGLSAPWSWDHEEFLENLLRAVPMSR